MANDTFTQKITLEGGDRIKASLLEIGEAGKKAFDQIGRSANEVGKGNASEGLDKLKTSLNDILDLAGSFGKSLGGSLTLAIGAFSGISAGLSAIGVAAADSTNKLVESAKQLGASTDQLQRLKFAASSAGIGDSELTAALGKIKTQFDEASNGAKTYFRSLSDIGGMSKQYDAATGIGVMRGGAQGADAGKTSVNFQSLASSGKDYLAVLQGIGDTLAKFDDNDPRKTAISDDLEKKFGKGFAAQMEDLGHEIRATKEVYDTLGLSVTDTDKEISKANEDSLNKLKLHLSEQKAIIGASISGIGHELALLFTPQATSSQDAISDFIETHRLDIANFVKDDIFPVLGVIERGVGAAASGIFTAFSAAIDAAKRAWSDFKALLAANDLSSFDGWKAAASQAFNDIGAFAAASFTRIVAIAGAAYDSMKASALGAFPSLAGAFTALEGGYAAVMARLKQVSATTWLEIGAGVLAFGLLFSTNFAGLALAAAPFWSEILEGAEALAPGLRVTIAPIRAAAAEMFGSVSALGKAAFDYIKALLSGDAHLQVTAFDGLKVSAGAVWADITGAFSNGYAWLRAQTIGAASWMAEPWRMLEQAVSDAWAWVKAEQQSGWQSIKGAWEGLLSTWKAIESGAQSVAGVLNRLFGSELTGKQLLMIGAFLQFTGVLGPVIAIVGALAAVLDVVALAIGVAILAMDHPAIASFAAGLYLAWSKAHDLADVFAKVKESLGGAEFSGWIAALGVGSGEIAKLVMGVRSFFGMANESATNFKSVQKTALDGAKKDHEDAASSIGDVWNKVWKELGVGSAGAAGIEKRKLPQIDPMETGKEALRVSQEIGAVFSRIGADVAGLFSAPSKTATTGAAGGGFVDQAKALFSGAGNALPEIKSPGAAFGGVGDWLKSLFGGGGDHAVPGSKLASSAKPATTDRFHESDDEARERDAANRYFGMPVIGKRALDSSVKRNDQFISEDAMKKSVDRNTSDFPVYPGYLPKKGAGADDEALNLSGSLRSTTTAFDGLIGKIGQFAAALVAPGNGSGLQMPGLGGLAMPAMAMAPAFASNGSSGASGAQPNAGLIAFTLGINGSQEQVYATREVIDDLRRLAAAAQMNSTTKRSPSWDT